MSDDPTPSPSGTPTSKFQEEDIIASPVGTPTSIMPKTIGGAASPPPTGELPPIKSELPPIKKIKLSRAPRARRIKHKHKKIKDKLEKIERTDERVAISILTLLRPDYLRQCVESIFPITMPQKVIITNQADYTKKNMAVINKWKDNPHFHYRVNDPPKWPGASRAEVFTMAKESGFEYIITLDDDCKLLPGAVDKLVKAADDHPEFYAISGFLITPHRGKYMLGGSITVQADRYIYLNYGYKTGVREADFISNGFRLVRLEPLVVPDSSYTIGLTDFDWAMEAKSKGMRLAVCGEAGAYHKFMFIDGKPEDFPMSSDYRMIRRNRVEIRKMRKKFEEKWGFKI